VFAADHGRIPGTREAVYGVVSMVLWSLFVVVTIKYVGLATRADNDREGAMMALVALVRRLKELGASLRSACSSRPASSAHRCSSATRWSPPPSRCCPRSRA
jgi:K+ transporter